MEFCGTVNFQTFVKSSLCGGVMASIFPEPTGEQVAGSSYEQPDVFVDLKNGGKLHVSFGDHKKIGLTLFYPNFGFSETKAVSLSPISIGHLEDSVKSRKISVDFKTLRLKGTRTLERVLKRYKTTFRN